MSENELEREPTSIRGKWDGALIKRDELNSLSDQIQQNIMCYLDGLRFLPNSNTHIDNLCEGVVREFKKLKVEKGLE